QVHDITFIKCMYCIWNYERGSSPTLHGVRMGKMGDFIRYRHTVLLGALVMCEALNFEEETLWCLSIKVMNGEMEEWKDINKKSK
ncbi:hypothetical protein J1N35_007716, partial [Gossypium stocksii]